MQTEPATNLKNVFQPNLPTLPYEPQLQHEPNEFRSNEIVNIIKNKLSPKKYPGCDHITPKMIIELPYCAVCTITQLFNAIAKLGHYPVRWKKSIIIMTAKPGKVHTIPTLYRPISLLSYLSKLFKRCVIPSHQFGFREKHVAIEQVNGITSEIRNAFEKREYCTAMFLDFS